MQKIQFSSISFPFVAILLAATALSAYAKTNEFEWCTVVAPDVWVPGGPFEVSVTLKEGVGVPKRKHVGIPGFGVQTKEVEPGDGEVEFSWTFPGARRTSCFFLLQFIAPDGDAWPWDWRGGAVHFRPYSKFFYVEPDADFGMYEYGQTPSFTIHWGAGLKQGAGDCALVTLIE